MPLQATYIEEEERLDLSFAGNLDVTLTGDICHVCSQVPCGLRACIVDLSNVQRIFDSGVALLQMLYRRLTKLGTTVVILAEHPDVRACVPMIMQAPAPAQAA